jgi:hypothetical protein
MIMRLTPNAGLSESWRCSAEASDWLVFLIALLGGSSDWLVFLIALLGGSFRLARIPDHAAR